MGISFSWLLSSSRLKLVTDTGSSAVRLSVRNQENRSVIDSVTFSSFLQSRCPSLFAGFKSAWWLNSGHLQTAYCVLGDFSKVDKVVYDRTLLRLADGGTLGLDSTPPLHERTLLDDVPIVVVMHGLTGGSHESYVRMVLAQAVRPKEEGGLGYRGIVVNFRACAGVPLTSDQLYSAGHTDDIRQALVYISQRYPKAPLLGVGFSLGANVIVRYLGEEGKHSRLRAACVLGCPWDLLANSSRLEASFFLRNVYSKAMGKNLINLMQKNASAVMQLPPEKSTRLRPVLPDLFSLKSPTLYQVDSRLTSVAGGSSPPFPFPSAEDYYIFASSHKCLPSIRVPFLAINADDDPIVGHYPVDVDGNGYVALALTSGGGHLGWFESDPESNGVRRWISKPVLEWLRAVGEDLCEPDQERKPFDVIEDDGWLREAGREQLGIKLIGDAGEVQGVEDEGGMLQGL